MGQTSTVMNVKHPSNPSFIQKTLKTILSCLWLAYQKIRKLLQVWHLEHNKRLILGSLSPRGPRRASHLGLPSLGLTTKLCTMSGSFPDVPMGKIYVSY